MTDRFNTLTVVLEKPMRDDDSQCVIDALKMVRCVQDVTGNVADMDAYAANSRARQDWADVLFNIMRISRNFTKFNKLKAYLKQLAEEEDRR
jgi:hypothetical protein